MIANNRIFIYGQKSRVNTTSHLILYIPNKRDPEFKNSTKLLSTDIKNTAGNIFLVIKYTPTEIINEMQIKKIITLRSALGLEKNIVFYL